MKKIALEAVGIGSDRRAASIGSDCAPRLGSILRSPADPTPSPAENFRLDVLLDIPQQLALSAKKNIYDDYLCHNYALAGMAYIKTFVGYLRKLIEFGIGMLPKLELTPQASVGAKGTAAAGGAVGAEATGDAAGGTAAGGGKMIEVPYQPILNGKLGSWKLSSSRFFFQ